MKIICLLACSLFMQLLANSQSYFEGEIIYRVKLEKKDPDFDLSSIISYPASTITLLFSEGNWINAPDSGIVELSHFRQDENRDYYKFRGVNTLLYYDYAHLPSHQDSLLSINTKYNTDTVLGYICHRLILTTSNMRLTLVYNPVIAVDPKWFANTKGGYYDIIYRHTKSLYLKMIIETDRYMSTNTAIKIQPQHIDPSVFESLHQLPKRLLE